MGSTKSKTLGTRKGTFLRGQGPNTASLYTVFLRQLPSASLTRVIGWLDQGLVTPGPQASLPSAGDLKNVKTVLKTKTRHRADHELTNAKETSKQQSGRITVQVVDITAFVIIPYEQSTTEGMCQPVF